MCRSTMLSLTPFDSSLVFIMVAKRLEWKKRILWTDVLYRLEIGSMCNWWLIDFNVAHSQPMIDVTSLLNKTKLPWKLNSTHLFANLHIQKRNFFATFTFDSEICHLGSTNFLRQFGMTNPRSAIFARLLGLIFQPRNWISPFFF